jgi:hypothetical protein
MTPTRLMMFAAALTVMTTGAGCARKDWDDGLARMPANLIEAACLKADNCTVYCKDGGIKDDAFPHWCRHE